MLLRVFDFTPTCMRRLASSPTTDLSSAMDPTRCEYSLVVHVHRALFGSPRARTSSTKHALRAAAFRVVFVSSASPWNRRGGDACTSVLEIGRCDVFVATWRPGGSGRTWTCGRSTSQRRVGGAISRRHVPHRWEVHRTTDGCRERSSGRMKARVVDASFARERRRPTSVATETDVHTRMEKKKERGNAPGAGHLGTTNLCWWW
mmetsp:Transcript_8390/g.52459  ORF Transcript_8390/g.52459 Transcript_8390/m.52459 type:complete len:204 (+) Transcript_8390:50-661(+)